MYRYHPVKNNRMFRHIRKYLFLLASLIFVQGNIFAGQRESQDTLSGFIQLSAKDYPVTSNQLPMFTMQRNIDAASERADMSGMENKSFVDSRENAFLGSTVKVSVLYPECQPLTSEETALLKKSGLHIPDNIKPHVVCGISRKKRILEISLCPIFKKNGVLMRLTSCKISLTPFEANRGEQRIKSMANGKEENATTLFLPTGSSQADMSKRWKNKSVLASGKWVKISVKEEGIYQLTAKQLKQNGFADINRVKIYGYGGRMIPETWDFTSDNQTPDDLCEVSTYISDDKLFFFAEGTTRWTSTRHENNPYSIASCYFVTEGDQPLRIATSQQTSSSSASCAVITHHVVLDSDEAGFYEGGRELYDGHNFAEGNSHTFKLATPSIMPSGTANVDIAFAASSKTTTSVGIILNNAYKLPSISVSAYGSDESARESRKSYDIPTSRFAETNAFKFTVNPVATSRLNYIRIHYPRQLKATDAPYAFSPEMSGSLKLKIADATSHSQLWQIANGKSHTVRMQATLSKTDTLEANVADGTQRFVVFNDNQTYPSPAFWGVVGNQNLHADSLVQMVIIIPSDGKFLNEANRLAEAHRKHQNLNVKVVTAMQLYNEFSSGTPDASAYRRYLKMLYDRAATTADAPQYLLFMGPSVWDNRLLTTSFQGKNPDNYLLIFEVSLNATNSLSSSLSIGDLYSYTTDDFFSWLDDGEGVNYGANKPDISIGRFPCPTTAEAAVMVNKSIAYLTGANQGTWQSRAYVLGDDKDNNLHMRGAEDVANSITSTTGGNLLLHKSYWDAYKRTYTATGYSYPQATRDLQRAMREGALLFDYVGHGSPDQVSHARVLVKDDFSDNQTSSLPLWILASCKISPYDMPQSDIGRTALFNPNGGAVAVLCASRSVFAERNVELNTRFCRFLLKKGSQPATFGEALLKAKTALITSNTDATINKLKYALLGDPALPVALPRHAVVLDSINGQPLTPTSMQVLKASSVARFSGHIETPDAAFANTFSGVVNAVLSDKMDTITCVNNTGATKAQVYQDRTKTLMEINDSVRNGRFVISMSVPRDISYSSSSARITFFASDLRNNHSAIGHNEQFCLNGTSEEASADTLAPQVFVSLDNYDFPDGGIVSSTPLFLARVKDDVAVNTSGVSLGHDMSLCIDNDPSQVYTLTPYFKYDFGTYNAGSVSWQMPEMQPGKHTLSFKAWDVNNNSTTAALTFYVGQLSEDSFDVNITENPVKTATTFILHIPEGSNQAASQATIEIFDAYGRRVWSHESQASKSYLTKQWNVSDTSGTPLPAGIYLFRATMSGEGGKLKTATKKLIIR